eukprot:CAMPEP_0197602750 /NCGR_PEP_ID=MMETSP1326-20131121/37809_1 /TAXON_ID=1155430 /ORGANISM="Genus nov. species nov., Strain RCC2288" /LENGTH=205 /DNA_ID=CAMNT_0043170161 /DNA_START=1 /DNA_END=614 /DNA_ORIENTATION=-
MPVANSAKMQVFYEMMYPDGTKCIPATLLDRTTPDSRSARSVAGFYEALTIFDGTLKNDDLILHLDDQCNKDPAIGPKFCEQFLAQEYRDVNNEIKPGFHSLRCTEELNWKITLTAIDLVAQKCIKPDGTVLKDARGYDVYESSLREPVVRIFYNLIAPYENNLIGVYEHKHSKRPPANRRAVKNTPLRNDREHLLKSFTLCRDV